MKEHNENATYAKTLDAVKPFGQYCDNEIGVEMVADPAHLEKVSKEQLADIQLLVRLKAAHDAKVDILMDYDGNYDSTLDAHINGLNLIKANESLNEPGYDDDSVETSEFPEALQEALTEERFELAIQAAKQMDPNLDIPEDLRDQFLAELNSLSSERLAEICSVMQKPTINIVPANSFEEKIAQMNKNKHYDKQNDVYVVQGDDEPYKDVKSPNKARVYLDDGKPKQRQIEGAPTTLETRREFEAKRTSEKNLDFVGPHRYACLEQQSLIEAGQAGDNSRIIDFETITVLNPKNLTKSKYVACAGFSSDFRGVGFDSDIPDRGGDGFRGRASVQILEF